MSGFFRLQVEVEIYTMNTLRTFYEQMDRKMDPSEFEGTIEDERARVLMKSLHLPEGGLVLDLGAGKCLIGDVLCSKFHYRVIAADVALEPLLSRKSCRFVTNC